MAKAQRRSSLYALLVFEVPAQTVFSTQSSGACCTCVTTGADGTPFQTVVAARTYFSEHVLPTYADGSSVSFAVASIAEVQSAVRRVRVDVEFEAVDLGGVVDTRQDDQAAEAEPTAQAAIAPVPIQAPAAAPTEPAPEAAPVETPPWDENPTTDLSGACAEPLPPVPAEPEASKHEVPAIQGVTLSALVTAVVATPSSAFVLVDGKDKLLLCNAANPEAQNHGVLMTALRQIYASGKTINYKDALAATEDSSVAALFRRARTSTVMQQVIRIETLGDVRLLIASEAAIEKAMREAQTQAPVTMA